jgi:hypothetical protein
VLAPARLEHQLHRRLAHVEVEPLAQVLDVDEVGARLAHQRQQARQRARPVGHAREEHEPPARFALVAARDRGQQTRVDVAAAEHDHRRAARGGRGLPAQQRGHADCARALDDELGLLHEHDHRLGHVVLGDDDHVVEPAAHEAEGQLAGALDRDAVGDRQPRRDLDGLAAPQRLRIGGDGLDLHAHHLDLGPRGLHRDRHAAGEPAAAHGDDDLRQVGDVVEQLEAERPLARHDVRVVERMHEGHAGLLRACPGRGHALLDRRAAAVHDRAELPAALGLRQRRLDRHEHLARDAARPGGVRQGPRVVARAPPRHPLRARLAERG